VINSFHMFQNISSNYLHQVHGYSVIKSGFISSLTHILVMFAPFVGLAVDCRGGRIPLLLLSSCTSILAYSLLVFSRVTPVVSLLLISFCLAITPPLLMASIPLTMERKHFGIAFGIVEVANAVGSTIGNIVIGYVRDSTGSYEIDMYIFLGMGVLSFLLCVVLHFADNASGGRLAVSVCTAQHECVNLNEDLLESSSSEGSP